jgi:hypothetical protein
MIEASLRTVHVLLRSTGTEPDTTNNFTINDDR